MRKTTSLDKVAYPAPDVITKVIPAPTEGWDAISPLADMSPQRAPILDNFVPRPGFVESRKGYQTWINTSTSVPVETLMVYQRPAAVTMYAAAGSTLFDVTASATISTALPIVIATSYAGARWEWTNFTPAGAATVIQFVNGMDVLQQISGTVRTAVAITGLSVVPGPPTTANFTNIHAQKRRLWYIVEDSTIAIFMPTDAITGPIAGYQDLGALWSKGGSLLTIGSWTIDGGQGPTDYVVFLSSMGQISIYAGTDPTSASDWQLKGTFNVAPPIGKRCLYRFGSDLLIITHQGVLPISQVLPFDPSADRSSAVTSRIQNAMIEAAATYGDEFGWEIISYPLEALLFLNVPLDAGNTQWQYVMNTVTGAWCRFKGWNANTFAVFNDMLMFGDNTGGIKWAYKGGIDGTETIYAEMQVAFNWFDNPGRLKRMTFLQPLLTAVGGQLTPSLGVDVDFANNPPQSTVVSANTFSLWDVALWDVGMWSGNTQIKPWLSINALGKTLAIHMVLEYSVDSATEVPVLQINAFNSVLELGGMV